ncbi:MAG: DUF3365 domain-containing protein [Rhodospirillales bacterium]|nr:DUF3365 domain-containing protein [Rhodospirillales bacterium]
MLKGVMTGLLFGCLAASPAMAQDMEALKGEAKNVMMKFGGALKGELKAGMEAGGPVNAIGVCNEKAPAIAAKVSGETGWTVRRTSHKLRNPASAPDALEQKVLQTFLDRIAKGEAAADLAFATVVEENGKKTFRFIKAIPTEELCLNCHGEKLNPEVVAKLDKVYPGDKARGFKPGEMRGVFTLSKPL